jgi:glycopeptide antibiotics resistance protein
MASIIIVIPYIVIPFAVSIFWKKCKFARKALSYIFVAALIFVYPFILFSFNFTSNPAIHHFLFDNYHWIILLVNTLFFIPLTLLLQVIFNSIMLINKEEEWHVIQ